MPGEADWRESVQHPARLLEGDAKAMGGGDLDSHESWKQLQRESPEGQVQRWTKAKGAAGKANDPQLAADRHFGVYVLEGQVNSTEGATTRKSPRNHADCSNL